MKMLAIVCRILLGLVFVFFGGLGLFMHPALPPRGNALGDFVNIFHEVGWAQVISVFQVIGGLLVLFGGTVPFGLCILCPITVNILLFHILFHAVAAFMIAPGIVVTILEIVLLYAYRGSFAGIWTTKATQTL
jgi:putative oxidoreductase